MRKVNVFTLLLLLCLTPLRALALPQDESSAVIFAYFAVGDDGAPESSITLAQFQSHVAELKSGGYNVAPLPVIVRALRDGTPLPPRTVTLTFDGVSRSVVEKAIPLLLENRMPFTLFVATDLADNGVLPYANWGDLKRLANKDLVTFGLLPASYARLADTPPEEIKRQINKSRARLRAMLGVDADLFAYPYGEYSASYRDIISSSGFDAALGQQSGVAWSGGDFYAIPRFSMTENFGDIARFRLTANALPLPVSEIEPSDPYIKSSRPVIGFTVDRSIGESLDKLACYASEEGQEDTEIVGGNRVEIRLDQDIRVEEGSIRLNCTLPVPPAEDDAEGAARWRWFGMLLTAAPRPPPRL